MQPSSSTAPVLGAVDTTQAWGEARRPSTRVYDSFAALSAQEKTYQSDPKWKKYSQLVQKTLESFDQVNEWADFITFQAKLLKCLQTFPQFTAIPHKLIVAKRLSQCLNPALPTGVHQRALDVYTHILTTIGTENLRRDLPAWSSGLFPFFQYAATSVKPIVLGIYERFYIPLQESLRPATKAFILALLPGLEEETGEFFEKVAALLDRLSGTVSPAFFFQNIWLVLITAPKSRIPALNYLSRRLPKVEAGDSLSHIIGNDIGLMIRGFAAALEDTHILVQRGILDLMIATLQIDSVGFLSSRKEDQVLLMRAVLGVVLRRDLSLSRRLYTWLLGPSEDSTTQIDYLRKHSLDLLHQALKADMEEHSELDRDRQRPYKIFISLLDKWEIGQALTEVLVLEAFSSLQSALRPGDDHDELLMTGNVLFEVIDPFLLWKQLYGAIRSSVKGESSANAIELARFIARTFRMHDEEVQKLHAPFVAFATLDAIDVVIQEGLQPERLPMVLSSLKLVQELLQEVSSRFFESTDPNHDVPPRHLALDLSDQLYSAPDIKQASLPETEGRELLASGLTTALSLAKWAAADNDVPTPTVKSANGIVQSLSSLTAHCSEPLHIPWEPVEWCRVVLHAIEASETTSSTFESHSAFIATITTLQRTPTITPSVPRNNRRILTVCLDKLFAYLRPPCSSIFVEAAQLIWSIEELTDKRQVESMLAEKLSSADVEQRTSAFESFGNLWRFTEDSQLPGRALRLPMFIVLDSLRDDDLATKRAGEAWMRCSLKSYLRVLDPLIYSLLDPKATAQDASLTACGVALTIPTYSAPFDRAQVQHVIDSLLSLARFGGQGFVRIAKSSFLKHTLDGDLRSRVRAAGLESMTYLDGLVFLLSRLLVAEVQANVKPSIGPVNALIHSVVAEVLQVLVSRGETELSNLQAIEGALMVRLLLCIDRNEMDLQNKLLHVLHSVVHVLRTPNKDRSNSVDSQARPSLELSPKKDFFTGLSRDELFVKVFTEATSRQDNSAILHHWVDFLLMTIPHFRQAIAPVVLPLVDGLVARLQQLVDEFEALFVDARVATTASATEADFAVLTNALERLLLIAINESFAAAADDEASLDKASSDNAAAASSGGTGLLGYMTGVLGTSEQEAAPMSEAIKTKRLVQARIESSVHLLLSSWSLFGKLDEDAESSQTTSKGYYSSRASLRSRKALERVFKACQQDSLHVFIAFWSQRRKDKADESRLYECLDQLVPSAQSVVSIMCERLNVRTARAKSDLDDLAFAFFASYVERLEGTLAVQAWTTTLSFVREYLAALPGTRASMFACLRVFTLLSERVSQTPALEDRRMKRDMHETFTRLVEAAVQQAGKTSESGGWTSLRKAEMNGDSESVRSEKGRYADSEATEKETEARDVKKLSDSGLTLAQETTLFLASRAIPAIRRFSLDADRTSTICSSMVQHIIAPSLRTRSRTFDVDARVFDLLVEMVRMTTASKAWRPPIADAFGDNRFFNASPSTHAHWAEVVTALMAADKERFPDLIAKVSTGASANIFTNRELESLSRALAVRRISYTVLAAEKDKYLTQLPLIQEKLVDLLRSPVGDIVHAEVYLCLRVLFCRIDHHHLAGLWPVILTELLRLFESLADRTIPDGSDLLQLVFSACKFLDLTLALQTEEFQIHGWMFVTDTVDAMYPPDAWMPQAIIDRLGEVLSASARTPVAQPGKLAAQIDGHVERRAPFIRTRRIERMSDLEPFFSKVSLANYEAVYNAGTKTDFAEVEKQIVVDIFDGPA